METSLTRALMAGCGFYEHEPDSLVLADCLTGVWAALPVVTGFRRGQSAYAGDGVDRALTQPETVIAVLHSRLPW